MLKGQFWRNPFAIDFLQATDEYTLVINIEKGIEIISNLLGLFGE